MPISSALASQAALASDNSQPDAPAPEALNQRRLLDYWLGLLLVVPWLSPYTAGPTPNAWPWLISAFCAVGLWLLRHRLNTRLIASAWLLAAAVSAAIGLLQYFGLAQVFSPWISQTAAGEAFANLRQRNQFATLTSIGLIALIALITLQVRKAPAKPVPGWAFLVMLLLALGNAASLSRTGLLQWALVLAFTAGWALPDFKARRALVLFALQAMLAYLIAGLALPWLLQLSTGISSGGLFGRLAEPAGCASRKVLWSNVLTLIAQKPWLGWGWGELSYAHFMTLYPGPRFCEILDNAHNLPLHLAVELGVPAALTLCLLALWLVWRAKPWRETDSPRQMAWAVLAVIMLHSLLEYPLWYGPFQIAFVLSAGLLWAGATRRRRGEAHAGVRPFAHEYGQNSVVAQWMRAVTAIIIIAILLMMAVSYKRVSQIYLPPEQRMPAYRDDPLKQVQGLWLYRNQARFAELSITALTPDNAAAQHAMARELLHYSPEPRVIEKLIESAVMMGRDDEALQYLARYRAAFAAEQAAWAKAHALR